MALHLVEIDKRSFLYLGGPLNNDVIAARFQGVHDAHIEHEDTILKAMFKEYSIEFGMEAISKLPNIRDYDAIICGNDMIAYGVLKMLSDFKIKVPEEIAVTGFDNIILSKVETPPITTVDQHNYELGQKSVVIPQINTTYKCIRKASLSINTDKGDGQTCFFCGQVKITS